MSTNHVLDELSAYIDGECRDAQRITRHLQSCPECARRHMELLRLSNHLRAMPRPEVSAAFTARVLASLGSTKATPRRPWPVLFLRHPSYALALAASLILIGIGALYSADQKAPPRPSTYSKHSSEVLPDDEALVVALEELLREEVREEELWEDALISGMEENKGGMTLPEVDVLLDTLAAWTLEEEPSVWYEEEDWTSMMDTLALETVEVLSELTKNNWNEV